ncbi:putative Beta-hexosaminidase subunit A2 [Blattamonas nauphoetae]|uniref:Beta-hexosaminidase n=1 Tax=Blattamonas nauphoetae TaxID=2049346 RepID=A0ABQ9WQD4_9EUKA|nr:putative Beta-hexosaminidase subunit A2 [Blattamonas nauphoetae]
MNVFILFSLFARAFTEGESATRYHIIPRPVQLVPAEGEFTFNAETRFLIPKGTEDMKRATGSLAERLRVAANLDLKVEEYETFPTEETKNVVILKLDDTIENKEGYTLSIKESQIISTGKLPQGCFHGLTTVRQLLPPQIESKAPVADITWQVPQCQIVDYPLYSYRGMMLDVCRHFTPKEGVKRYIDLLAYHKMSIFHFHLTEDQGWRIEIKKYPKLTEIGAWRSRANSLYNENDDNSVGRQFVQLNEPYGGFFTQEEIKEIVAYATDRFIIVQPELEIPGHVTAALAAYPELGCTGGPYKVITSWGIFSDVFCAKDTTFQFLEDVWDEYAALFPGPMYHMGGDECPKGRWTSCQHCQQRIKDENLRSTSELQAYFVRRQAAHLAKLGKRLIGWDEIMEGGLADGAAVMSWRGTHGGTQAAKTGHDAVMTPMSHCYFDFAQATSNQNGNETNEEGFVNPNGRGMNSFSNAITLQHVYGFEPCPSSEKDENVRKHIIGGQCNVWTERLPAQSNIDYNVFPRMASMCEALWTNKERKEYDHFQDRLNEIIKAYDVLGINYCKMQLKKLPVP